MRFSLYMALISTLAAVAECSSFQQQCSKLASKLKIENATAWFSEYVAAGTNMSFPDTDPSCAQGSLVVDVDFCRVAPYVATSHRSGISMEAWLPKNWTGRFLSTGNGGLNGCLSYDDMAYTVELGFSTVGAKNCHNGHNGTSGAP